MKVALIGHLPPPIGGRSIYIKRYSAQLQRDGHDVRVVELTKMHPLRWTPAVAALRLERWDRIELHVFSLRVFAVLLATGLSRVTQLVLHNDKELDGRGPVERAVFDAFVGRCKEVVVVGEHLLAAYGLPEGTRVQPCFLPPLVEERDAIRATYPAEIQAFVTERQPLLVANASRLVREEGVDLYGLDMCIDLIDSVRRTFEQAGLLFAVARIEEQAYFDAIARRIEARGLAAHVLFLSGERQLWPLLEQASVMLRPTARDAYGASVAEALHFGVPAIASDVCQRPDGTVLFRSRDAEDLLAKTLEVLLAQAGAG